MCSGLPVPGMTQVTAGLASTNFSRICAQLVQPISAAQAGSLRPESLRSKPTAAERLVHDHRRAAFGGGGQQAALDGAVVERVVDLHEIPLFRAQNCLELFMRALGIVRDPEI